ncbi:hypothetical protein NFI96_021982 [Prochilodus magdalenae]|nr:hypothetical protein NFI96_021982 [Prochilodus magdalenae]
MPSHTEQYEVLGTIGSGSYGKCQKIRRKSDGKRAVVSSMSPLVSAAPSADGCTTQDYMHTDRYHDCPEHHVTVTKDCSGVVPDGHGVTQNGSGSSSVTSPALVLVETPNESVCGGTVVSTKMNGLSSHVQKTWCPSTSTPTSPSAGTVLVWKELDYGTMAEAEKQMLVSEVNLLRELKHPNIVRYYDRIIDRTNTTLYIVMEYCEGGDLASLITRCIKDRRYLEEEFILRVMAQLALALKECHGRSNGGSTVLHRDLKPANIFLNAKQNVKLGDFGLARILKHETSFAKTFVGTPYYMSPTGVMVAVEKFGDITSTLWILLQLAVPGTPPTGSVLGVGRYAGSLALPLNPHFPTPVRHSDGITSAACPGLDHVISTLRYLNSSTWKRSAPLTLRGACHPPLGRHYRLGGANLRTSHSTLGCRPPQCTEPVSAHAEQMNRMSYNEKSDIWSLGCLLYELCALSPPFTAYNQKDLAEKIKEGKFRRIPYRYSEELNTLLSRMLHLKLEHPHTVPADGAVGVEVEGHQVFWTCDYRPSVLVLTTVPPHTDSSPPRLKRDSSLKMTRCHSESLHDSLDYLRPSVDSILQSSLISSYVATERRKEEARQRRKSSADSGQNKQPDPVSAELRLKEQALRERERALKEREERLEQKEQELCIRERLADENLARAESLLKTYNLMKQQRAPHPLCSDDIDERENTSPGKKKVHFAGDSQENLRPERRAAVRLQDHMFIKKLQAAGTCLGSYPLKSRQMQGIR